MNPGHYPMGLGGGGITRPQHTVITSTCDCEVKELL